MSQSFTDKQKFITASSNYVVFNSQSNNYEIDPSLLNPYRQIRSVVIGYPGSGKTSLVNKLCGTNFKSGIAVARMTTQMQSGHCKYAPGDNFQIWDTPALNRKDKNKTNHQVIRKILQTQNWNVIYVVVQLESRFEKSLTDLQQISQIIKSQCVRCCQIVYMISFSDQVPVKVKNNFYDNFSQSIQRQRITQKVIVFSNVDTNFKNLAEVLYNSVNQSSVIVLKAQQVHSQPELSNKFSEIKSEENEQNKKQFSILQWINKNCHKYRKNGNYQFIFMLAFIGNLQQVSILQWIKKNYQAFRKKNGNLYIILVLTFIGKFILNLLLNKKQVQ